MTTAKCWDVGWCGPLLKIRLKINTKKKIMNKSNPSIWSIKGLLYGF